MEIASTHKHTRQINSEIKPESRYTTVSSEKAAGAHYTPALLADFVARQIVQSLPVIEAIERVLDPAAGDGELLLALLAELKRNGKEIEGITVYAFDTDAEALKRAETRIKSEFPTATLKFSCENFLDYVLRVYRTSLYSALGETEESIHFDCVISNPPYVRTQVMGAKQSQQLAKQFNLSGRVDLYHAFLLAIAEVLNRNGVLGIIVSNRFMTTKSGISVRQDILKQYAIQHIWDLGDTKIFEAAVLPAVLLMKRRTEASDTTQTRFTSIYSSKLMGISTACENIMQGIDLEGLIELNSLRKENGERFLVEHGYLDLGREQGGIWRMQTDDSTAWLSRVHAHSWGRFSDIGKIRVGVKTTADKVFIRSDWDRMPEEARPELLKPLITHHIARRFRSLDLNKGKKILYPHAVVDGRRCAVALDHYPMTARYLHEHRSVLEGRTYVIESGRNWYEIWVPQDPAAWEAPKLVFREIAERPVFWIDLDGSIVNGDCYWLSCPEQSKENLLWLALAVGNSTFIEQYYDRCFCNKLYAGRRRFCTQYVEHFPLPDPSSSLSEEMIRLTKEIYNEIYNEIYKEIYHDPTASSVRAMEAELDAMTWQSFGVSAE